MKRLLCIIILLLAAACSRRHVQEEDFESTRASYRPPWPEAALSEFRGWDYLVQKLAADGLSQEELSSAFKDERLPRFTFIPFQLRPRETPRMYTSFTQEKVLRLGRSFLDEQKAAFDEAERLYGVSRYIIAAIMLVESGCGRNTGEEIVIYRLARLASVKEPHNLDYNYQRLNKADPSVEIEQVRARAEYLEQTFYPEVLALFELKRRENLDLLTLKGSGAGAFGLPQFLPSSYLRYAVDADQDESASLFSPRDAISSTAYYLSGHGWQNDGTPSQKLKTLWEYNRSEAYGEAVLKVSILLSQPPPAKKPAVKSSKKAGKAGSAAQAIQVTESQKSAKGRKGKVEDIAARPIK